MRTLEKHWRLALFIAVALALYFWATRQKIIATIDDTGQGMTVNGK